jgi:type 1 glutamine amidotransferase/nicotinamidase-related amidase
MPTYIARSFLLLSIVVACCVFLSPANAAEILSLEALSRKANEKGEFAVETKTLSWDPQKTAVIICDMWDAHWCRGATRRVVELAPAMNRTVSACRDKGVLIIHAPSSCMAPYENHPARRRAQSAPKADNLPAEIGQWCRRIPAEEQGIYPVDQTHSTCDCNPACPQGNPWKKQIDLLDIREQDAISDSGAEIWNLLEQRGINQVVLMGVHTNMCVLGRPFGLRNLSRNGKQVVLARDLTDTMYDSRCWPYVSHFEGTDRIVEHIEKFVCPTIVSTSLTGQPAFVFDKTENRPRAVFVIGEDEYKTDETLPAFAKAELEPRGIRCTFVHADKNNLHDFPQMEALKVADVMVLSVRRRAPKAEQLALVRDYLASGKPLVGIRTASHSFDARGKHPEGHAEWKTFDPDVLGGNYVGHHANDSYPQITLAGGAEKNPLLAGVTLPFISQGSLYKVSPLASNATPLLTGTIKDFSPEPVAWTNQAGKSRVFYTSLGHPDDFDQPGFRRLMINATFWALDRRAP